MEILTEQSLVNKVLYYMRKQAMNVPEPFKAVQIESGATAIGIPDVLVFYKQVTIWLECKKVFAKAVSISDYAFNAKAVHVKIRPGQLRMLHLLHQHRSPAFLCCITEYMDVAFVSACDLPENCLGEITVSARFYTLPYMLKGLTCALTDDYAQ